jgi:FAD synthetase
MKVLVFGSFDIIHKGHEYLLKKASEFGELHVVIARDETITQIKGKPPHFPQDERRKHITEISYVKSAYLGNPGDKYKIIEDIKPDIICLGYDQKDFTERLLDECQKRGLNVKIIRLDAYEPHNYKSSIFRAKLESQKETKTKKN